MKKYNTRDFLGQDTQAERNAVPTCASEAQQVSRQPYRPGSNVSYVSDSNSARIFVGEKFFGEVKGDVLVKKISGSKHLVRVPPGIANDVEALQAAEELGARKVMVIDVETGIEYRATMSQIFSQGKVINRGYGKQILLPQRFWRRGDEPSGIQLTFWR